ncbi:MAG: hypothetical protein ACNA8W_10925 [Bradymonadaceae bacterium]
MSIQSDADTSFLVAPCPHCAKDVLTARDLDDHGELIPICMHCEASLEQETSSARWVTPAELVALGYFVDGYVPEEEDGEKGCRGGSCGVRQPAN